MLYKPQTPELASSSNFIIQTQHAKWVIPQNCELLKLLITEQNLRAHELRFSSAKQCHCFVKRLFLLALEDEYKSLKPSPLATFARALATENQTTKIGLYAPQ